MMSTLARMAAIALIVGAALWPVGAFLVLNSKGSKCFWGLESADCTRSNFSGFVGSQNTLNPRVPSRFEALMVYFGPVAAMLLIGVLLGISNRRRKN